MMALVEAFGRARPATGFSTDLKSLLELKAESLDEPVQKAQLRFSHLLMRMLPVWFESLRQQGDYG